MSASNNNYKHKINNKNKTQRFHSNQYQRGQLLAPHAIKTSFHNNNNNSNDNNNDGVNINNLNKNANENFISGLLFSINPNEDFKAKKELIAYLSPIVEPYKKMYDALMLEEKEKEEEEEGEVGRNKNENSTVAESEDGKSSDEQDNDEADKAENEDEVTEKDKGKNENVDASHHNNNNNSNNNTKSLSSMLAAELAEDTNDTFQNRKRGRDQNDEGDDEAHNNNDYNNNNKKISKNKNKWLAPLETNCKGYLLFRIPTAHPTVTCPYTYLNKGAEVNETTLQSEPNQLLPPHTVVLNALISHINEALFKNFYVHQRFLLKYAFKYIPVEISCCPTLSEIKMGIELLLPFHFAPLYHPPAREKDNNDENDNNNISKVVKTENESQGDNIFLHPIAAPDVLAEDEENNNNNNNQQQSPRATGRKRRGMEKITIHLNVKNNTTFERQHKNTLLSEIVDQMLPFDKYIYIPISKINPKKINPGQTDNSVIHCLNIIVLHSTCLLSVSKNYFGAERKEYNLHNLGKDMISLHNFVSPDEKRQ